MNKRSLLAIIVTLVFGLSVAALAYQQTAATVNTVASCSCCKGDSCPMKKKDASGKETAASCDGCDCCKGDSCPMKKKGDRADKTAPSQDAKSCDCSCCSHKKNNS